MLLNREKLAWAAGFFSGEGSTTNRTVKGHLYPQIDIGQTDIKPLQFFQECVGGIGKIFGPYTQKNSLSKLPFWRYRAQSFQDVQAIIALMWIWLSETKKEQAGNVLKECSNINNSK